MKSVKRQASSVKRDNTKCFLAACRLPLAATYGFTLVELLVVIAIMGIVMVVGTNIFLGVLKSSNKSAILNQVRQEGNKAIDLMSRSVQNGALLVYPVTDNSCETSLIIKNKPANVAGSVGQKLYTRFTFSINPSAPGPTAQNSFIGLDSSDTLLSLQDRSVGVPAGTFDPANATSITNNAGSNSVNVKGVPGITPCFKAFHGTSGGATGTVIVVNFTLQQSKTAPASRKEYQGDVDFQSTFAMRAY